MSDDAAPAKRGRKANAEKTTEKNDTKVESKKRARKEVKADAGDSNDEGSAPVKRGRGRPKGSTKKKSSSAKPKGKGAGSGRRGRPKKEDTKDSADEDGEENDAGANRSSDVRPLPTNVEKIKTVKIDLKRAVNKEGEIDNGAGSSVVPIKPSRGRPKGSSPKKRAKTKPKRGWIWLPRPERGQKRANRPSVVLRLPTNMEIGAVKIELKRAVNKEGEIDNGAGSSAVPVKTSRGRPKGSLPKEKPMTKKPKTGWIWFPRPERGQKHNLLNYFSQNCN